MLIRFAMTILIAATLAAFGGPRAASVAAEAATPAATASWADVREAIAACICVKSFTHEENEYLVPMAGQCGGCRPDGPGNDIAAAVEKAYEAASPILISLKPPGLDDVQRNDPARSIEDATQLTREIYLAHEPFLRLMLDRIPAALTGEGLSCADCPVYEPLPVRHVAWAGFLPYLDGHVWPDPVVTPEDGEETADGERQYMFHVCIGLNGIAEMDNPDPLLTQAGFLAAFHTVEVREIGSEHFGAIIKEEQFTRLDDDDARTRYLRRRLPEEMSRDATLQPAVCRTLNQIAADIGLVIDECEGMEAPPETAALE